MKHILTILFVLCASGLLATDHLAEAEYYQKKADGYKLANMYTYGFAIPVIISVCYFVMVYNLFKLARIENNRTAYVCAWITLAAWLLAFAASLSIATISGM